MSNRKPFKGALAIGLAILLTACSSSGLKKDISSPLTAQYLGLQSDQATLLVTQDWWKNLGDDQLNQLIEQALQGQPNLAAVRARMARLQALADVTSAAAQPQTALNVNANRERFTANGIYPPPLAGNLYNMGQAQLGFGWSLDLFGLHAAEWAAAMGQVHAARADTAAAAVSLASQVSRGYIALGRLVAWRDIAEQTVQQQDAVLQLVRARATAGLDSQIDQKQSNALLIDARAQREALDEQIALVRHQLATLCGLQPNALDKLQPQLTQLQPQELPLNLGADLLGRRADVVAAKWRVEAATQEIKVAEKLFYPNVSLGAFVGLNAIGFNRVFKGASQEAAIAPALHLPLFDGGLLKAQLRGREGEADIAIANYNAVVLDAVKQASDAISATQSLQQQEFEQEKSLRLAQQMYDLTRNRFEAGLVNQLVLLQAWKQLLGQQRLSADVRARSLSNRISLLTALGGGWTGTSN